MVNFSRKFYLKIYLYSQPVVKYHMRKITTFYYKIPDNKSFFKNP